MASRDFTKIWRSAARVAIDAHAARDLPTFPRARGVRKRRLEQWTAPVIFLNQSRRLTIPSRLRYIIEKHAAQAREVLSSMIL